MTPGIYEQLGVRTIINCTGYTTRHGGSVMAPAVVQAMAEAATAYVDLPELLEAAGKRIAHLCRAEAAYVTAGAAAGLLIGTAACVGGADPDKIARLPDTRGMKNEVIIHRRQRMNFDHAIRNVGVTLVDIGWSSSYTFPWELEAAFTPQTAAVAFVASMGLDNVLPLETVIEIAHQHNVPVLVDAAPELPPMSNLWKYTGMGADLVVFSGGKDIHGPQASGFILGRADLIKACALHGNPNHNTIGRPAKVGKEEVAGLVKALELYLEMDHEARLQGWVDSAAYIVNQLAGVSHVSAWQESHDSWNRPIPHVYIRLDDSALGLAPGQVVSRLAEGTPPIRTSLSGKLVTVVTESMQAGEEKVVARRLLEILRS